MSLKCFFRHADISDSDDSDHDEQEDRDRHDEGSPTIQDCQIAEYLDEFALDLAQERRDELAQEYREYLAEMTEYNEQLRLNELKQEIDAHTRGVPPATV